MILYLLSVNAAALLIMLADKLLARRKLRRIPEAVLLLFAFCGGTAGAIAGMYLFSHKTLHPKFSVGLPILLLLQAAFCAWFFGKP